MNSLVDNMPAGWECGAGGWAGEGTSYQLGPKTFTFKFKLWRGGRETWKLRLSPCSSGRLPLSPWLDSLTALRRIFLAPNQV